MAAKKKVKPKLKNKTKGIKKLKPKKTVAKKTVSKKAAKGAKAQARGTKLAATVTTDQAMAAHAQRIHVGENVPNFEVAATGGKRISLHGLKGKNIVLYFYPKDATPGCTIEGHEFTKLHDEFKTLNAEVFGVSRDSLNSHEKFKEKECYSIDLLSDERGELCEMFDVIKWKNMYGRQVQGIERSTFVIDPDGKLIKEWRGVKAEGHAQEVLNFLRG